MGAFLIVKFGVYVIFACLVLKLVIRQWILVEFDNKSRSADANDWAGQLECNDDVLVRWTVLSPWKFVLPVSCEHHRMAISLILKYITNELVLDELDLYFLLLLRNYVWHGEKPAGAALWANNDWKYQRFLTFKLRAFGPVFDFYGQLQGMSILVCEQRQVCIDSSSI